MHFSLFALFLVSIFRDYKPLAAIIGGSLLGIFILALGTENFLKSDGYEARKDTFGCLVKHLAEMNVTDEYFDAAKSLQIEEKNCERVVTEKEREFYIDLRARLACSYPIYNVTADFCEQVLKPLCESESKSHDKSENVTDCFNLKNANLFDKSVDNNTLSNFHEKSTKKCAPIENCYECIHKQLLKNQKYEEIRYHASAVNYTIIEFQIWKYFSISPRVFELTDESKKLEEEALKHCVDNGTCQDKVKFCEIVKEEKVGH